MARLCPDAFPKGPRTGKTPVRGNISPPCIQIQLILARYARHASKRPRRAPLGNAPREHLAAKGRFRRPKPPDHARRTNLATLRWPCPCAGAPARAAASRDRLSTAWPLPRDACPSAPPMPATCQYLPPANACRLPCPSQSETSRRWASAAVIRRMACSSDKPRGTTDCVISTGRPISECCAEPGLDSRTVSKWVQNRRRRPQARPGLRQRCRKRPSKGRVPLDGAIGTPSPKRRVSANSAACAFASAHKGRIRQNAYHRLGNTSQEHDAPPSPARTNRYRFSAERRWQPNLQA